MPALRRALGYGLRLGLLSRSLSLDLIPMIHGSRNSIVGTMISMPSSMVMWPRPCGPLPYAASAVFLPRVCFAVAFCQIAWASSNSALSVLDRF